MRQGSKEAGIRDAGRLRGWSRGCALAGLVTAATLFAASGGEAQNPEAARGEIQGLAFIFMTKLACDRLIPGYKAATAGSYAGWRQEHAAIITPLEQSPDFQRMLAEADRKQVTLSAEEQRGLQEHCEDVADLLGPPGPPDPRFATPEKTWALFQASLRAGDRATALDCAIQRTKRTLKSLFQRLSDQDLRKMADETTAMNLVERHGQAQEGSLVRKGLSYPILFLNLRGEWKIYRM